MNGTKKSVLFAYIKMRLFFWQKIELLLSKRIIVTKIVFKTFSSIFLFGLKNRFGYQKLAFQHYH